jgi:cobalt-zinc-cadmium efflux system protein
MWHNHSHWTDKSSKNIGIAFALNSIFVVIEIIWWLYTNSMSIVSDALHDLWDSLALGIAWYVARYANKSPTLSYTYGYKWYSLLSALLLWVILTIGSITIAYHSVIRIINPEQINSVWVIRLAVVWVIINGIGAYRTHTWSTQNEKIISRHLIEDVLWRVAVLLWGVAIYFTGITVIDPLIALWYSIYILYHGFQNIRETIKLLTQWTPDGIDLTQIKAQLQAIDWVVDVHDIHCWSLDGENTIFSAHIVTDQLKYTTIKQQIKHTLDETHHIHHSTLEFEQTTEQCDWWCE